MRLHSFIFLACPLYSSVVAQYTSSYSPSIVFVHKTACGTSTFQSSFLTSSYTSLGSFSLPSPPSCGQTYVPDTDTTYLIQCNQTYSGTIILPAIESRKQKDRRDDGRHQHHVRAIQPDFTACIATCDAEQACIASVFTGTECTLFSAITGVARFDGARAAIKVAFLGQVSAAAAATSAATGTTTTTTTGSPDGVGVQISEHVSGILGSVATSAGGLTSLSSAASMSGPSVTGSMTPSSAFPPPSPSAVLSSYGGSTSTPFSATAAPGTSTYSGYSGNAITSSVSSTSSSLIAVESSIQSDISAAFSDRLPSDSSSAVSTSRMSSDQPRSLTSLSVTSYAGSDSNTATSPAATTNITSSDTGSSSSMSSTLTSLSSTALAARTTSSISMASAKISSSVTALSSLISTSSSVVNGLTSSVASSSSIYVSISSTSRPPLLSSSSTLGSPTSSSSLSPPSNSSPAVLTVEPPTSSSTYGPNGMSSSSLASEKLSSSTTGVSFLGTLPGASISSSSISSSRSSSMLSPISSSTSATSTSSTSGGSSSPLPTSSSSSMISTSSPSSRLSSSSPASFYSTSTSTASTSTCTSTTRSSSSSLSSTSLVSSSSTTSSSAASSSSSSSSRQSSSSPSTSSPASTPNPMRNTGKRGLSFTQANYTTPFSLSGQNSHVSWSYNWFYQACPLSTSPGNNYTTSTNPNTNCSYNPALEYIPLLYSSAPSLLSAWPAAARQQIALGATALMSFNEPDVCYDGSACMTLNDTITTYQTHMQPFAGRALLGAPAVTNAGSPSGLAYLQAFLAGCANCTVDFVAVHWYSNKYAGASYFEYFVNQTRQVAGGRPIWITEFGLDNDGGGTPFTGVDVEGFLERVLPWLDQQGDVARYAYFMDAPGILLDSAGSGLSEVGVVYNNFTNATVQPYLGG